MYKKIFNERKSKNYKRTTRKRFNYKNKKDRIL